MDFNQEKYFEKRKTLIRELGFKDSALLPLKQYLEWLWEANRDLNLFSRQMGFEDLIDRHLIDSLLPLKHFPSEAKRVADFGTGGGLPGVIYALHFSESDFFLFEKSPKKRIFLNKIKSLSKNIYVESEIPKNLVNMDLIMARAFKPLPVIFEMSAQYFEKNGQYFLFKGRLEKIKEEESESKKKFPNLKLKITELHSPLDPGERHLVERA